MLRSLLEAKKGTLSLYSHCRGLAQVRTERQGVAECPRPLQCACAIGRRTPPTPATRRRVLGAQRGGCVCALTCTRWGRTTCPEKTLACACPKDSTDFIMCPFPFTPLDNLFEKFKCIFPHPRWYFRRNFAGTGEKCMRKIYRLPAAGTLTSFWTLTLWLI